MARVAADAVFCPACSELHQDATALIADHALTIEGLERDARKHRAAISRLEGERFRRLHGHKLRAQASEVLLYWQTTAAPNAMEPESLDRLENCLARVPAFGVERLKQSVDGYASKPYVVEGKRCRQGRPTEWQADAELIFRTPKHVERGIALALLKNAPSEPSMGDWQRLDWRRVRRENHRLILKALRDFSGEPYFDPIGRSYHTDCPRCESKLTVFDEQSDPLLICSGCGLDEGQFLRALQMDDDPSVLAAAV